MSGPRRTTGTILGLALGALGAPPAHGGTPATLAGVTVVSGSRSGHVDVRVPRAVTLSTPFGGGDDITVSGGGALAAVVLVGTGQGTRGVTIAGGASSLNGHARRFLLPVPQWPSLGGGTYEDTKTYSDTTLMPAGTYRLYFVSSAPATVTLRLRSLSGRTLLRPGGRTKASVSPADHELSGNPVRQNVFAASNRTTLTRRGFALQALQSRLEVEAAWQLVMCHDNPAQAPVAPLRDSPGCPSGEKHTFVNHRYPAVAASDRLFVQAYAGLPPGEHGLSTIYTSESNATAIGYSAVWIEY